MDISVTKYHDDLHTQLMCYSLPLIDICVLVIADSVPEELKYKYVLVELFSADCMAVFTNIIQVPTTS